MAPPPMAPPAGRLMGLLMLGERLMAGADGREMPPPPPIAPPAGREIPPPPAGRETPPPRAPPPPPPPRPRPPSASCMVTSKAPTQVAATTPNLRILLFMAGIPFRW